MNHTAEKLLTFIKESPTAFQAVEMMKTRFTENGFTELKEDEHWEIKNGGKYFVIRNHSAIIAFTVPEVSSDVFHIIASHSDSPSLKDQGESRDGGKWVCEAECGTLWWCASGSLV